jgi:DnaJ-domain-containing protein 1
MKEPLTLNPTDLFSFLARPEPAVLFLSVHPAHRFNCLLCQCYGEEGGAEVAFGQLHLHELVASRGPALSFLHGELLACGVATPIAVPPGYYLFQHSRLLAWNAGLPAAADVKRIIRDSLLGAALSLLTRNLSIVATALRTAAEAAAAEGVAMQFRRAVAMHREDPQRESNRHETTRDDLASAYRVLQVDPGASDEEVSRAWRVLQQKFHPDRGASDPEEFDRLSRRCVEINRARDIIRNHRRRAAAG